MTYSAQLSQMAEDRVRALNLDNVELRSALYFLVGAQPSAVNEALNYIERQRLHTPVYEMWRGCPNRTEYANSRDHAGACQLHVTVLCDCDYLGRGTPFHVAGRFCSQVTDETAAHVPHLHTPSGDACRMVECHELGGMTCTFCGGQPCRVVIA